jgi:hypothetical protein
MIMIKHDSTTTLEDIVDPVRILNSQGSYWLKEQVQGVIIVEIIYVDNNTNRGTGDEKFEFIEVYPALLERIYGAVSFFGDH